MLGGTYGRVVTVIAGPGNNGADGRVAGRRLADNGVTVRVLDAAATPGRLAPSDLVIDAAYGTGFRGEWAAPDAGGAPVLAVDIPSGVDGLTGAAGAGVLRADRTVTFAALKPGLLLGPGKQLAGIVEVADIGLNTSRATVGVVQEDDAAAWWPRRPAGAHKWHAAVRVVAGSPGMTGSAQLAAHAAMRAGSGMVVLSVPGEAGGGATAEVVGKAVPADGWAPAALDGLERFGALVIGPGLGRSSDTVASVRAVTAAAGKPLVIDADGLVALGNELATVGARPASTVLTPHDGEFAALTGGAPGPDRLAAVRHLAAEAGCVVLLKGPSTLVAEPGGLVRVIAGGDQRLATAGTGDVLAGVLGALLASGAEPFDAAAAAAWIHAAAARRLPARGLIAGDLLGALPAVVASWP
jgi:NAD(P)H-hydrate epimerase